MSPIDPPRELVVRGLYRYVRNPMYLSVTTILFGELLPVQTRAFLVYFVLWIAGGNLFVVGFEEPILRQKFGASYEAYLRSTF